MGVVVFGVDRAIIMGDSVKCASTPVIIPRQSVYEPMTTGLKTDTARASAVTCTALAPVNEHGTPVPAVTYAAPAPVTEVRHWHLACPTQHASQSVAPLKAEQTSSPRRHVLRPCVLQKKSRPPRLPCSE